MAVLPTGIGPVTGGYQIERSLRFNPADTAYLSRTFSTPTNNKKWTMSGWIKRGAINDGNYNTLFARYVDGNNFMRVDLLGDNLRMYQYKSANDVLLRSTLVLRDPSAWYHFLVIYDSDNATSSNRVLFYINNTQITSFSSSTYPSSGSSSIWNTSGGASHQIGTFNANGSGEAFSGLMTECYFIDGQALTPSDFGETDSNTGVWKPKAYSGTYGTNGFYLKFADNSNTTAGTLGKDSSGNGNNWTPNNFSVTAGAGNDSLVDSPTSYGTDSGLGAEVRGNYATLNPLNQNSTGVTLANGNLDITRSTTSNGQVWSTMGMTSGKWYAEVTIGDKTEIFPGIANGNMVAANRYLGQDSNTWAYYNSGQKVNSGTYTTYGNTYTDGDTIGVAFDADAGSLYFYKNGTVQNSGTAAFTGLTSGPYFFACSAESSTTANSWNFGQRAFAYTAPSGFKALCTQNLPTPTIGATSTTQADNYFSPVLYTGTGSTRSITSLEFQPDFTWIKPRSAADYNILYDAVRGVRKQLYTSLTNAEETETQGLSAFLSNGFTVGGAHTVRGQTNDSGVTYVAWNWKANGAGSSNTAGSITSTVSANTTSGFSIVTYTGTGVNATVGHGLGVAPSMIIIKMRSSPGDQAVVYHSALGANKTLRLDSTGAAGTTTVTWQNTAPSTTVFSIGDVSENNLNNANGKNYVAYCFAPVAGYSAFGSYTGNGSTDGPFIFTNFRPRFVIRKCSGATGNWFINDAARDSSNVVLLRLNADLSDAESSGANSDIDFLSNGFKIRATSTAGVNQSGQTHIYMAFAENPFKYSLAR